MKREIIAVISLALLLMAPLFAKSPNIKPSYGDWEMTGSRLYQNDLEAGMAKANLPLKQQGTMVYNFTLKYVDGIQDGMGGVGIHVFVDKPAAGKAYGEGNSFLLWLNYDENPASSSIPAGLSAQIYKSSSYTNMKLVQAVSLKSIEPLIARYLDKELPVKLEIDSKTGRGKVYNPFNETEAYTFSLGKDFPKSGNYVSLRTNSLGVSFGY
ncbi:MAG: hypothetical protein B6241_12655 [Spirochaetaceae bacterium 4572_59]|nr:MAG: hypothetical protein B6241_12655 [Spirochaetaceae bacterium 4572_59]